MTRDYRKIKAWQYAHGLAVEMYKLTHDFPRSEIWALTSQIRRSAVSVPTNIVEGSARRNKQEYVHFLYIAYASLKELEYLTYLSKEIGYLKEKGYRDFLDILDTTVKTLRGLITFLEKE